MTKATYLLTFDIDWSPDWIIEEVANILREKRVRSTWFVTHDSPAIRTLATDKTLFELGIHPNCLPGSTQGKDESEVLARLKQIVPDSISMRTHALYQTSGFLMKAARDGGMRLDSTIFLPKTSHIATHDLNFGDNILIKRAPFFWADDMAIREGVEDWTREPFDPDSEGLRIFSFHPFHIVLNTRELVLYERLKQECLLNQWTKEFIAPYRNVGSGPTNTFEALVDHLADTGGIFLRDLL